MMMNIVTLITNIEHSCKLQISKPLFTGKPPSCNGTALMTVYRITHIFPGLEERNFVPDILDRAKIMKLL